MDANLLIGAIQIDIAAIQLKLDHFTRTAKKQKQNDLNDFYNLGEAIRILEYALAETVAFVGQTNQRIPNPRLAILWEDSSRSMKNIDGGAALADLSFEKNLYWRDPEFFQQHNQNMLYRISLDNVLYQLRKLRSKFEKIQNKIEE